MTDIGSDAERHQVPIPQHPNARLVLGWGAFTDIGRRREHNEDSFLAQAPIFAVADGMGGHSAGDVASTAVVVRLFEGISGPFADAATIGRALAAATTDMGLVFDAKGLGVGTTVTGAALSLRGNQPFWTVFNVGDSRVYLFERGELRQLTVDHSVVQELVDSGATSAADAQRHPDSNVITRAVGFNVEAVPDFQVLPVRAGGRLLVCSDGLNKELPAASIRAALAAGKPAAHTARALVEAALAAGGRDNITTIVIDVLECSGLGEIGYSLTDTKPIPVQ